MAADAFPVFIQILRKGVTQMSVNECKTIEVRYTKAAEKAINAMDRATKDRIHEGILGLMQKPPKGNITPLQGYNDGRCRLRIGKYRIIYRFGLEMEIEILYILKIGSRGDIYK